MGKRIDDLLTYNPSPLQRTILFRKQQHVEEDVENQKKKFTPLNPSTNGTKKNIQNGTKNQGRIIYLFILFFVLIIQRDLNSCILFLMSCFILPIAFKQ